MSLTLKPSSSPRPHEKSIPSLTQKLMADIEKLGYVIHPVIVDSETNVIVDGTHRIEALQGLRIPHAPVYAVDYLGEEVRLETWARLLKSEIRLEDVESIAAALSLAMERLEDVNLAAPRNSLTLIIGETVFEFVQMDGGINSIFSLTEELDKRFKDAGLEYVREGELLNRIKKGDAKAGYMIPRLEKRDVIKLTLDGVLLPPKSTRHIVNGRPMFIFCPLNILKQPAEEAGEKFRKWLDGGRRVRLPPCSLIDRVYEEPVEVYYFESLRHLYPQALLREYL